MATKKEVYTVISKALRNNRYRKDKAINKICIRIERKDKHNNFYNRFVNEDIKKKYCTYGKKINIGIGNQYRLMVMTTLVASCVKKECMIINGNIKTKIVFIYLNI